MNNLAKTDPRKFWKNIKKSYKKSTSTSESLTVDDLYNYFWEQF